jgi:hypothetical protein
MGKPVDLSPNGIRLLVERANAVVAHGPNIAYPSRAAAQHIRDLVKELGIAVSILGTRLP